jgi:cysteine desulfurase family protein
MVIYLDNAATSYPKPDKVYCAVEHAMRQVTSPGRGGYYSAIEASRLVFQAREKVADFFGIGDSSRVVFTHSATEALNLGIRGLVRSGDHIITSTCEHNSVVRPLHLLEQQGCSITRVPCDAEGFVDPLSIESAIGPTTRLIAITHCSNVTGAIQPISRIGSIAQSRQIPLLVDAAQSAGEIPIDVKTMGISLLAAPGHKGLLGPQGTGFLYIAEGLDPAPLIAGGTGGGSSAAEQPLEMPERYESGTPNTPGIAGLGAAIDYLQERGIGAVRQLLEDRMALLLRGMRDIEGITLYGPSEATRRGGLVSFVVNGLDPSEVGFRLDREFGISVRTGLHCAPDAHRSMGTFPSGTIRVSPGLFTSEEEIKLFLSALRTIAQRGQVK